MVQKGLMPVARWKLIHPLSIMRWLGKSRSNPATGSHGTYGEMFSEQSWWDAKWEIKSVQWIDTWRAETLGFCFTQLHFNAEQHKYRNNRTIYQLVCPEKRLQSNFVFSNWLAVLRWGFLGSMATPLWFALNGNKLLLCHWHWFQKTSKQVASACFSQTWFPQFCNFSRILFLRN